MHRTETLCFFVLGGGGHLKTAAGFQSVAQNSGQWHLCDDKRLCWCQNGLRHVVRRFFNMLSPLYHIYSYRLSKLGVCCLYSFMVLILKLLIKRECICFSRIRGKIPCCAQQETNDKTTGSTGF